MKEFLLAVSLTSVVISIITLILPKGKTSFVIKTIVGFFMAVVILQTVTKIDFSSALSRQMFGSGEIYYQEDYLSFVREQKKLYLKEKILISLEKNGIKIEKSELNILTTENVDEYIIEKITVDLNRVVISDKTMHINIKEEVVEIVSESASVSSEAVVVYGC